MKILAVDTATEACSAALLCESKVTERYQLDPRGHSRRLMSMIEALLFEAGVARTDLDGILTIAGRDPLPVFGSVRAWLRVLPLD